ncbi:MAG TPA: hypothetical protein DEO86_18140 [Colwellia sp.]|nr:hypothetical protein [Colwellia sp.]|tara:strand:+ start:321 stop:1106 length:786 start_codon:yes stop_codon:yes gene_type:complete
MSNNIWWGEFNFEHHTTKCWSVGERAILIKRKATEWNTWNLESKEEDSDIFVSEGENFNVDNSAVIGRFLEKNTSETLKVFPLLADRTVIARPSSPLTILAGEKIQLFISTPIWFYAETLPSGKCLVDLPFWRPSDSWFGRSTIDGQLCYAKYTSAKTQLDELDLHPHRATTSIMVVNSHHKALTINRVNVPVNYLHLYSDDKNQLWTSRITIEIENESSDVELIIEKGFSGEFEPVTFISTPRLSSEHGKLIRRISNLFG